MEIPGKVIFASLCGAIVGYALARQLEGVHSKLLDLEHSPTPKLVCHWVSA
ncbi:hypothetical protein [Pseudoalteromonas rubra]|uniref:hypothetical protein n=1 Tax=Pseudoalteromonas rubra TaxID=43658 RepID=UPI0013EE4DD3|nr:hypothetical protein [Pseudoalteromonas rubra]